MDQVCFLEHYPLENHYDICWHYLHQRIDWSTKAAEIHERGVTWFDVSDGMNLFPHLELDKNYALVCYLSSEYHGIWGRVAAVPQGASPIPTVDTETLWAKLTQGTHFELPGEAAPPMEAIYHDGTTEGYFEALLCSLFLSALPYVRYEQERWDIIMTKPPADLDSAWDSYMEIPDWRPRMIANTLCANTLLVFRRKIENGFGASSGKDRIYLSEYNFQNRLNWYHTLERRERTMYHGRINDDTRYTEKRRCCVSTASSILIACEKEGSVKGGIHYDL